MFSHRVIILYMYSTYWAHYRTGLSTRVQGVRYLRRIVRSSRVNSQLSAIKLIYNHGQF